MQRRSRVGVVGAREARQLLDHRVGAERGRRRIQVGQSSPIEPLLQCGELPAPVIRGGADRYERRFGEPSGSYGSADPAEHGHERSPLGIHTGSP